MYFDDELIVTSIIVVPVNDDSPIPAAALGLISCTRCQTFRRGSIKLCVFDTPMRPTKCELIFVHIGIRFSDEKSSPSQTGHVLWNAYFIDKLFFTLYVSLIVQT